MSCSPPGPLTELRVGRKMDLVGFLEVEALVSSSPCSFSPPLSSSDIESSRKKGSFGSHLLKQGKTSRDEGDDPRCPKTARSIHHSHCSNGGQQMFHLSSNDSSSSMHSCENPPSCSRAGFNCGKLNARPMGPFTAPQRMDLEQQMLIYSYINANVPIPTSLLTSLRTGFNPAVPSACSNEPFGPNGVWWGYFHPGLVGSLDPEPSRCRRTDGKKWRCSRDAVPDQKYCERHINRGRHRSRKPVERHGGHVKASTPPVVSRNHAQNSPDNTSATTSHSWMVDHQETTQELYPLALNTKPGDPFLPTKDCTLLDDRFNQLRDHSVANNNLLGPLELYYLQNQTQSHTDCSTIVWTGEAEMHCKRSQVSLSLPMSSPDFSSSTSSPAPETFSPLHMRLGLGGIPNEKNPAEEMNWKPSYWESTSIGGPLGEALTSPNDQSLLTLMNDGWAMSPPRLALSTSNAMQSAAISSVSSSSANDLVVETNTGDGFGCCYFAGANTRMSSSDLSM